MVVLDVQSFGGVLNVDDDLVLFGVTWVKQDAVRFKCSELLE
jgi:hypothetical protein